MSYFAVVIPLKLSMKSLIIPVMVSRKYEPKCYEAIPKVTVGQKVTDNQHLIYVPGIWDVVNYNCLVHAIEDVKNNTAGERTSNKACLSSGTKLDSSSSKKRKYSTDGVLSRLLTQ